MINRTTIDPALLVAIEEELGEDSYDEDEVIHEVEEQQPQEQQEQQEQQPQEQQEQQEQQPQEQQEKGNFVSSLIKENAKMKSLLKEEERIGRVTKMVNPVVTLLTFFFGGIALTMLSVAFYWIAHLFSSVAEILSIVVSCLQF